MPEKKYNFTNVSFFLFLKVSPPRASNYSHRKNKRNKIVLLRAKKQEMCFRKHSNEYDFPLNYGFAR